MDIKEILKNAGIEIPEDKQEAFNKDFHTSYKSDAELSKVKTQLTDTKTQLDAANAKIAEFGDTDPAKIKQEAADWKAKAETAETDFKNKLAEMEVSQAIEGAVSGLKFTSKLAKESVVAKVKSAGLKLTDGKLIGFDDIIKGLKESDAGAFVPDGKPKPQFGDPKGGGAGAHTGSDAVSMEDALKAHYNM